MVAVLVGAIASAQHNCINPEYFTKDMSDMEGYHVRLYGWFDLSPLTPGVTDVNKVPFSEDGCVYFIPAEKIKYKSPEVKFGVYVMRVGPADELRAVLAVCPFCREELGKYCRLKYVPRDFRNDDWAHLRCEQCKHEDEYYFLGGNPNFMCIGDIDDLSGRLRMYEVCVKYNRRENRVYISDCPM